MSEKKEAGEGGRQQAIEHVSKAVAHGDLPTLSLATWIENITTVTTTCPLRGRADYSWPGGKRLAVYFALNLEHFSFGEGLGAELAPGGPQPDVLNYAWRDYGNRVGAWYLLDAFDALNLPMAALVNSAMYDYAPELVAALPRARRRDRRPRPHQRRAPGRPRRGRRARADRARRRRVWRKHEGRAPEGWLGPWISHSHVTPDLLAEAGYTLSARLVHGRPAGVVRLPRRQAASSRCPIRRSSTTSRRSSAARRTRRDFADMIVDQFDEMLELSAARPLVMGVALHAYIVGQPHRLRHLQARAAPHRAASRRIWLTTPGAIARHCLGLPAGTPRFIPLPR